jgi:hypothetical protein
MRVLPAQAGTQKFESRALQGPDRGGSPAIRLGR